MSWNLNVYSSPGRKDVLSSKKPENDDIKNSKRSHPETEQLKNWINKGGTKEEFLSIAALDSFSDISLRDIEFYESILKKNPNSTLVSDLNTKLLMELKEKFEAERFSLQLNTQDAQGSEGLNLKI